MDPLKCFHLAAGDFLVYIARKRVKGEIKDAQVLEEFYAQMLSMATRAADELHMLKLSALSEHYKAKILEQEMKTAYNELFKRRSEIPPDLIQRIITQSVIPTRKQLSEEVIIKTGQ